MIVNNWQWITGNVCQNNAHTQRGFFSQRLKNSGESPFTSGAETHLHVPYVPSFPLQAHSYSGWWRGGGGGEWLQADTRQKVTIYIFRLALSRLPVHHKAYRSADTRTVTSEPELHEKTKSLKMEPQHRESQVGSLDPSILAPDANPTPILKISNRELPLVFKGEFV